MTTRTLLVFIFLSPFWARSGLPCTCSAHHVGREWNCDAGFLYDPKSHPWYNSKAVNGWYVLTKINTQICSLSANGPSSLRKDSILLIYDLIYVYLFSQSHKVFLEIMTRGVLPHYLCIPTKMIALLNYSIPLNNAGIWGTNPCATENLLWFPGVLEACIALANGRTSQRHSESSLA